MSEDVTGAQLVVAESSEPSIIRAASSQDVALAITEYQRIQEALDKALPDCIMEIQGKSFRKKNYWRAVATAFNLEVVAIEGSERIERADGDWSVLVTYRATANNGRSATGDGACSASEKSERQRTVHNVRSHAHTRAYNRAVSNLVGFGEVSAEEVERDHQGGGSAHVVAPSPPSLAPPPAGAKPSSTGPEWLDEPLGFGKHRSKTWRHFLDSGSRQAVEYLEWFTQQEHRGRTQEENHRKASAVLDMRAARG